MSNIAHKDINRKLCVGLILSVLIEHYTKEEQKKEPLLFHIKKILENKNEPLCLGTVQERKNANKFYMEELAKLARTQDKKDEIALNYKKAVLSIHRKGLIYNAHVEIVNNAFSCVEHHISKEFAVSASGMIFAILRKNEDVTKWYKFNKKKIEKNVKEDMKVNKYTIRSSKFVNMLLAEVDAQIDAI